ncbi:hypothetical protein AQ837_04545 [Burkholderia pseudomallei]|nr:hypothetical protein BK015_28305 [Burkholderia pseudomallei]OMR69159.1 hypothetical protein AQ727_23705 [Burkholderia pseudomallei]OMS25511.1 hypothetical protein AQ736_14410 [Burkholderia pseudomallei]OMS27919.1 hypothetical protein AQ739_16400 [Burkholderia pseudomallei]OMT07807.1 hypothetical protein AQ750_16700 [Burkholderia pseudomallei]
MSAAARHVSGAAPPRIAYRISHIAYRASRIACADRGARIARIARVARADSRASPDRAAGGAHAQRCAVCLASPRV